MLDTGHIARKLIKGINSAMRVEKVALFQWSEKEGSYVFWAGEVWNSKWVQEISANHPLVQVLSDEKSGVMAFELANDPRYQEVREKMLPDLIRMGVELALPIRFQEKLTGFLLLGRKKSGELYGAEDVELLQMLSRSVSVALANAEHFQQREEQFEINAQLDKIGTLGQLVASFSHEVGNKIGALAGGTELLVQGFETLRKDPRISQHADLAKLFEQIEEDQRFQHDCLMTSVQMVKEIKEFVRMSDRVEPVDLKGCVELVKRILDYDIGRSGINFELECAEGVPRIPGNPGQIHEVLMNLFINSRDAIQSRREAEGRGEGWKGRIEVRIGPEGEWIRLEVADNGCGIPKENVEKVMRGYFTTKAVGKGTGMGVSFIRKVMERHGGKMGIESDIHTGTRMVLLFPIGGVKGS
ncbi:MAG: GAF domain-containing protein [Deltaproteobacteria bacterium]|nr:GAF domain-containing protein [Deltaproteobacteria bacterium]